MQKMAALVGAQIITDPGIFVVNAYARPLLSTVTGSH
jgi:hypothetical protein